jgi:hypothetical protein
VITRNVASKHYCLLQVLVATLPLVSCSACIKMYPDPLDCHKYYLRIDNSIIHQTCPNSLFFNQYSQQCNVTKITLYIPSLGANNCNQNMEGYYCNSFSSFTYCTHDNLTIVTATCPSGQCLGSPYTQPCVS